MTLESITVLLAVLTALGATLIGGVFFAFSSFVMKALMRIPAPSGIAAMQAINVTVLNRAFLSVFVGTLVCAVAAAATSLAGTHHARVRWLIAGAVLYFVGTFLVTLVCNVPRNNRLGACAPDAPDSAATWTRYCREWTAWNHVRTAAALAAGVCCIMAVRA